MELVKSKGSTSMYLKTLKGRDPTSILESIGSQGDNSLARSTPIGETGRLSAGWKHTVTKVSKGYELGWYNNGHPEASVNVALLVQYGHGTGTGGYVPGINYINTALSSVFKTGSQQLMREMSK